MTAITKAKRAASAAGAAALDATLTATLAAAGKALKGTVAELQTSAFDLLDRMIVVQP